MLGTDDPSAMDVIVLVYANHLHENEKFEDIKLVSSEREENYHIKDIKHLILQ